MFNRVQLALLAACAGAWMAAATHARAADLQVERGKYLVALGGCSDCHTPGNFLGHPDMTRYLGGSDVGFAIPVGTFFGPNLTPDKETGLGNWSREEIVTALSTGTTPQGRILAGVMPWRDFGKLTHSDLLAIADYLKSLPPVSHKVAGPFGPTETPIGLVMTVIPGNVYAGLPKPPAPK
jgi:mono/diheme cytochrome c family protein